MKFSIMTTEASTIRERANSDAFREQPLDLGETRGYTTDDLAPVRALEDEHRRRQRLAATVPRHGAEPWLCHDRDARYVANDDGRRAAGRHDDVRDVGSVRHAAEPAHG